MTHEFIAGASHELLCAEIRAATHAAERAGRPDTGSDPVQELRFARARLRTALEMVDRAVRAAKPVRTRLAETEADRAAAREAVAEFLGVGPDEARRLTQRARSNIRAKI